MELCAGVTGQIQPVESVDRHGQAAAVKTDLGGFPSPAIGCADKPTGGPNDIIAQSCLRINLIGLVNRLSNEKIIDPTQGLNLGRALAGRLT